jgi:hypothetical protein
LRNEETNQFAIADHLENEERYNDPRRWCCYEATLLMKKNEIRKDRKHPLTTPEYASVRQSTLSSSKRSPSVRKQPKGLKFFLGKEKKRQEHFSFSIKEISTPLALLSILQ